jgi:hypothetical protein
MTGFSRESGLLFSNLKERRKRRVLCPYAKPLHAQQTGRPNLIHVSLTWSIKFVNPSLRQTVRGGSGEMDIPSSLEAGSMKHSRVTLLGYTSFFP